MLHLTLVVLRKKCNGVSDNMEHHMILRLVPMVSYVPNSYVAPHFDYLDLRNMKVALMVLSRSHDTDSNAVASGTPMPVASCDANSIT